MAERQRIFFDRRSTRQRYLEIVDIAFLADQKLGAKRRTKPATMKSFLRVIECHARDNPTCRIKKKTIADEMNVTTQTVNRASKDLEECGVLYVERSCSPKDDAATVYGIDWKALMEAVTDNPTTYKKVARWITTTTGQPAETDVPKDAIVTSDKPIETDDNPTETRDIPTPTRDISTPENVAPTSYSRERVNHHQNHLTNISKPHDHEVSRTAVLKKDDLSDPLINITPERLGNADAILEMYSAAIEQNKIRHSENTMQSFFRAAFHCHHAKGAKNPGGLFRSLLEELDFQGNIAMDELARRTIKGLRSANEEEPSTDFEPNRHVVNTARAFDAIRQGSPDVPDLPGTVRPLITRPEGNHLVAAIDSALSSINREQDPISGEITRRFKGICDRLRSRKLGSLSFGTVIEKFNLHFDEAFNTEASKYRHVRFEHLTNLAPREIKRGICDELEPILNVQVEGIQSG